MYVRWCEWGEVIERGLVDGDGRGFVGIEGLVSEEMFIIILGG